MKTFAEEAALHSALISGFDPRKRIDSQFGVHCQILHAVLGCQTGVLTHPVIINMELCGHRERVQYRPGIKATEAEFLPDAKYLRSLLLCWWFKVQRDIARIRELPEVEQRVWVWEEHDFLICLEPFKSANGRVARVVYYMLTTALKLEPHLISAEKAATYNAHKSKYRREVFAPLMRSHGYIR